MTAAIVAEAIAKAEDDLGLRSSYVNNAEHPPVHFVGRDSSATHIRLDIHDAALRHLAERVERLRAGLASFGVDPLGWEPSVLAATILNDDAGGGRSDITCESWQERATRAEAALMRIVEIGDGVGFDVAVAALRTAGLLDAEETDDG